nr:cytochrome c biogenesis CcdA family protein [Streptomyces sp. NK15101]
MRGPNTCREPSSAGEAVTMITLALTGVLGGLITAVSPCILPVLPVVFLAGGPGTDIPAPRRPALVGTSGAPADATAAGELSAPARPARNRRSYAVVAGLALSFAFFTLLGVTIVSALGLSQDILRYVGLVPLVLIGPGLIFPPVERILEKPFARISQRQLDREGSAFVLGLGLGLLYVPCAGPVLAAITVAGARGETSADIVVLAVAFAIGTAIPLLVFALAFDVTAALQRALPDYAAAAQRTVEDSDTARQKLSGLYDDSDKELSRCEDGVNEFRSCGQTPPLARISTWINTPGGRPVDLTEGLIREPLRQADPTVVLPPPADQTDDQLTAGRTPETYLSAHRRRRHDDRLRRRRTHPDDRGPRNADPVPAHRPRQGPRSMPRTPIRTRTPGIRHHLRLTNALTPHTIEGARVHGSLRPGADGASTYRPAGG